jgi:hypothetical protein
VEALLVVLHLSLPGVRLVDLDAEGNLPTWFSSVQLAALAAAAAWCFRSEGGGRAGRWVWGVLAAGFLYLSFDEAAVVHERVLRDLVLETLPVASGLRAVPPWQLVFAPAAALAAGAFTALFVTRMASRPWCLAPALGGLALWGLSFAFEGAATSVFIPRGWYRLEVAAEELCEMAGATLLLVGVMRYAGASQAEQPRGSLLRRRALAWAAPAALLIGMPIAIVALVTQREQDSWRHAVGERLLDADRYAEAMAVFEAVLQRHPDDVDALRGFGTSAFRSGDLEAAERAFERAAALAPGDHGMRNALSLVRLKRETGR